MIHPWTVILWESVMSCFCKKVFSITLIASYRHRALHPWPQSGNGLCQLQIFQLLTGTCWKHPVCPFPLPSRSSAFFFAIYLSVQDDLFQAVLISFQMAKILQLQSSHFVAGKYSIFNFFFKLSYQLRSRSLPSHKSVSSWWNMLQRIGYVHMSLPTTILRKQLYRCVK